jgi:hypothetical protein
MSPLISIQDCGESGGKTGYKADSYKKKKKKKKKREREKEVKSRCSLDKLFLSCLILTFVYLLITGAEAIVAFDHTHNR